MKNQRGVVSLITSILISLLFVVVVVSMVDVLTREQRQATDADQSSRAFYAAETGVEDGLSIVKNALSQDHPLHALMLAENNGNCVAQTSTPSPTAATYTCLILSRQNNSVNGILSRDGTSEQIDLSGVSQPIGRVEIDWNLSGGQGNDAPVNAATNLPTTAASFNTGGGAWGDRPAVVQVTTVRFQPHGLGNFRVTDPADLNILENLIIPTSNGTGVVDPYDSIDNTHNPVAGVCSATTTAANPYNCHVKLKIHGDSGTAYKHVIRIRARYNGTHFAVRVYNTSEELVSLPDQYENIDVTAKAGGTSRRVRAKIAIIQNTASLDYALFSDHDICKDFQLRDSRSGNTGGSGYNSANQGSCPF